VKQTKAKSPKRPKGPHCLVCDGVMTVKRVIPAAHIFPELRTYQCEDCGVMRSVESEKELAPIVPEIVPAADIAQKAASAK
jgi:acetone carboxylase gamma subunit